MTDLQKFQAVNSTETLEQLAKVIESFANADGEIHGRKRVFVAKNMAEHCRTYNLSKHNVLTREFGIRQQAMMILFYNK